MPTRSHHDDYDKAATQRCERALITLLGDLGPWRERIYLVGGPFAFGLAGGERRGLGRRSRRLAPVVHVGDDGVAASREHLDQLAVDAVDVGMAVADLLPADTEPGRELGTQVRLIQHPGGLRVREQLA